MSNEQCETVWYLNMQGEVRQEALGLRDGWRQSDRFRFGEEKTVDQFQHLYLEPERAPSQERSSRSSESSSVGDALRTAVVHAVST